MLDLLSHIQPIKMKTIINLSRGVPDPDCFPVDGLIEATDSALRRNARTILQYGPAAGYAPLREFIGRWFGRAASEVMIGNGSLELFGFVCEAYLKPGDVVFVESPTYDRALTLLKKHNVQIVGIEVNENGIDLAAFESALKKHAPKLVYLIPDFQNPTGVCSSLEARTQIVQWSRTMGFLIVEDGPYGFLRYFGSDIPSIYSLAPEQTIHLSSFTKLISPGVRIGFLLGNQDRVKEVAGVAEGQYITPGYFAQGVVSEWCSKGHFPDQLERLRKLYAPRLATCVTALNQYLPGKMMGRPQGGFFASIRLDVCIEEHSLIQAAKEEGLILSSGNAFFADTPRYRFVRLPFCAMQHEEIVEGIKRLSLVVQKLSPPSAGKAAKARGGVLSQLLQ